MPEKSSKNHDFCVLVKNELSHTENVLKIQGITFLFGIYPHLKVLDIKVCIVVAYFCDTENSSYLFQLICRFNLQTIALQFLIEIESVII